MLGVLITIVKMVSLARVIPEAALFAFGALTLMFAVVVTFDPRMLWDLADRLGDPSARPLPRTAADSAAVAVASTAGPPVSPSAPSAPASSASSAAAMPPAAPHQG
jgi:paraquat-inducible protein A